MGVLSQPQQRVALARALVVESKVLLLDELEQSRCEAARRDVDGDKDSSDANTKLSAVTYMAVNPPPWVVGKRRFMVSKQINRCATKLNSVLDAVSISI